MLVSVGERVSCALTAMAIVDLGHAGVSLTGSQAGIVTDTAHGEARSSRFAPSASTRRSTRGAIVLVAGFQGVSTDSEVTTLGRGGRDPTAVALAAALGPTRARSPRTRTASAPRRPGSSPRPASCRGEPTTRCSRSPPTTPSCSYAPSSSSGNHGVLHVRSSRSADEGTWVDRGGRRMLEGRSSPESPTRSTRRSTGSTASRRGALLRARGGSTSTSTRPADGGRDRVLGARPRTDAATERVLTPRRALDGGLENSAR